MGEDYPGRHGEEKRRIACLAIRDPANVVDTAPLLLDHRHFWPLPTSGSHVLLALSYPFACSFLLSCLCALSSRRGWRVLARFEVALTEGALFAHIFLSFSALEPAYMLRAHVLVSAGGSFSSCSPATTPNVWRSFSFFRHTCDQLLFPIASSSAPRSSWPKGNHIQQACPSYGNFGRK